MYKEVLEFVNGDSARRHEIGTNFDAALCDIAREFPKLVRLVGKEYMPYCYGGYTAWINNLKKKKNMEEFYVGMKYEEYFSDPKSIFIYVEKGENGKVCFYVCLSIRPKKNNTEEEIDKYYRFLDMPLDTKQGIQYVAKYNSPRKNDFSEQIFHGMDTKTITNRKSADEYMVKESCTIELGKIITDDNGDKTEEQLAKEVEDAVNALMPYYDYVLGIERKKTDNNASNYPHNLILYGPPGTGKTYHTAIYAVAICKEKKKLEEVRDAGYENIMECYYELREEGRIGFTTFHQSFGYDDFIEGIRPVLRKKDNDETSPQLEYEIRAGVFLDFCRKAKEIEKPCVFIIDELNRGNISRIFGELMTLIESTKREGMPEAVTATLPYSGEEFSVPSNVYIIGTMNTADRSIAMLDTALRRRFSFREMMPEPMILEEMGADKVCFRDQEGNEREINVVRMLEALNQRIEALYDRDHTIGQAYFKELRGANATMENLQKIFKDSIFPLLQEYFFDDYYKIHVILGDNIKLPHQQFVQKQERVSGHTDAPGKYRNPFMGSIDEEQIELPKVRYVINEKAFSDPESYIHIYQE